MGGTFTPSIHEVHLGDITETINPGGSFSISFAGSPDLTIHPRSANGIDCSLRRYGGNAVFVDFEVDYRKFSMKTIGFWQSATGHFDEALNVFIYNFRLPAGVCDELGEEYGLTYIVFTLRLPPCLPTEPDPPLVKHGWFSLWVGNLVVLIYLLVLLYQFN